MNKRHRETLIGLQIYLLQNLQINKVMQYLIQEKILTDENRENVMLAGTRRDKVAKFLSILPKRGLNAFDIFVNSLRKTSQTYIADELENFYTPANQKNQTIDGQMNEIHRETLIGLRIYLLQNLQIKEVMQYLIQEEILTDENREDVMLAGTTRMKKIIKFLSILPTCGPNAFDIFVNSLRKASQTYIADELENFYIPANQKNQTKDGQMNKIHRETLIGLRIYLLQNLQINKVMQYLIQEKILTHENREDVMLAGTRREKVAKFLSILPKRGPNAFDIFVTTLRKHHKTVLLTNWRIFIQLRIKRIKQKTSHPI